MDSTFGDFNKATDAATEYATINGTVNVPTAGTSKPTAKIQYKSAPETTKVYLLYTNKRWTEKLAFTANYSQVVNVDSAGNYQFDLAVKGTMYCIVIDINADGICDEFVDNIAAGSDASISITSFVRELNTDGTLILSVTADKDIYAQGDTMTFTVTGHLTTGNDIHVEVWNEGTTNGTFVWASAIKIISAGDVPSSAFFTHVIPDGWPNGTSFKIYVAIESKLLSSDTFTVSGNSTKDTIAPGAGSITINNGAPVTNSLDVTLNIVNAAAAQMILSTTSGDYNTSTWEPITDTMPWTFSEGAGTKTIYIKFADTSGNAGIEKSASITYTNNP